MSAFLDKADEIKARLEAVPALDDVAILVDRQKDIASDFQKALAKKKGAVTVILFNGYQPYEEGIADSLVSSEFVITVFTKPILRSNAATKADDMVSEIHKSLHGWEQSHSCRDRASVTRGRIIPNDRFLIHEIRINIKHPI